MKAFGTCLLLLVTLMAVIFFAFYIEGNSPSSGSVVEQPGNYVKVTMKSRKLKEYSTTTHEDETGHDEIEDYRPIDPVPSSKAIKPGPIQHGSPLIPFIPKPSPPDHPMLAGFP